MTSVLLRSAARKFVERYRIRSFRYLRKTPQVNGLIPAGYNEVSKICYVNYSHKFNDKLSWKRPEVPPRIWHTFEGQRPLEDGTIPRFFIQDIPEDRVEDVIELMLKHLTEEEGFCIALGVAKDPSAMEDFRTYWRKVINQGMSIVVIKESPDTDKKPVIVGANFLTVVTLQNKTNSRSLDQFKSKPMKIFFGLVFGVEDEVDILKKYNIDKYLGSIGLAVHSSFRGNGIGEHLLKVREKIGREYNISVTEAMFTMKSSQTSALRAGFELQIEREYSELLDFEGNLAFPGATGKFIQVMTKKLC